MPEHNQSIEAMGKLEQFDIVISNDKAVCNAGEILSGYVSIRLNDSMKMRGIYISFKGKGHVHFVKHKHSKQRKSCTATEYYFDERYILYNPESEGGESLPAGEHRFTYEFRLPTTLPSSFEGKYGYVRYYLKSHIDRPWKFDHTTKTAFTVICILDLNSEPDAEFPVNEETEEDVTCCCYNGGSLAAKVNLPRRGYVPGELIPITAEIKNFTTTSSTIQAELAQYITYHTDWHTKEDKYVISSIDLGCVEPQNSSTLRNGLTLHALPPSRLVGCSIIDILYVLKIRVISSISLKIPIELVIGTVPLQSVIQVHVSRRYSGVGDGQADTEYVDEMSAQSKSLIPPPTYEEYMYGRVNIRDEDDTDFTMGPLEFAPVYPCYKYPS